MNGHPLFDLTDLILPVGLLFVAITRAISAYRNRSFATAALAIAALFLGTALAVLLPASYTFLGETTGETNIARPVGHAAALIGLGSCVIYVGYATKNLTTKFPKFLTIPTALAVPAVFGFYFAADLPFMHAHGPDFMAAYGQQTEIIALWVVTLTYMVLVFITLGAMTWRYAPHAGLASTRVSLRIVTLACVFGVGYAVIKVIILIHLGRFGAEPSWADHPLRHLFFWYVPNVLVVLGLAIPSVAAARRRGPRQVAAWRAARTIRPLWEDMVELIPDLALSNPNSKEKVGTSVTLLYRRVIEIVDVVNRIRAYLPDEDTYQAEAIAQGLAGLNVDAYVRACQIADAVATLNASHAMGEEPSAPMTTEEKVATWNARTDEVFRSTEPPVNEVDLALNQAFWVQVGRYYPDARTRQGTRRPAPAG